MADPVGLSEIAHRLGVAQVTAKQWRQRGVLPSPRWTVSGRPAWDWSDVERWAKKTGRLTRREETAPPKEGRTT